MIAYLLQGLSLGLSGAASPGPFQIYLIGQTLKLGWRRALPVAFAPLISDGPILILVLFILTRLPESFLRVVQIVGGIFVLYLAWKAYRAWRAFQYAAVAPEQAARQSLWQAALMNLLNPNPYIFWSLLAGPVLIRGWRETSGRGLAFLFGFYFAMVGGSALLVILFGVARQLGPRVNRALLGVSALALLAFGCYQLGKAFLG